MTNAIDAAIAPSQTCLFTGVVLDASTKVEHTLLRALGGRIRSTTVSSSDFNNDCGSMVDPYLFRVYAEIILHLGPLMAREHKSGSLEIEVPGSLGTMILDENGSISMRGLKIDRDPVTHKATSVIGAPTEVGKRLSQLADGRPIKSQTMIPATEELTFFSTPPVVLPQVELSALKCVMLTFDHLLAEHTSRFTRSPKLRPVREFVKNTISTGEVDPAGFHRFSLGLQYDKINEILSIVPAGTIQRGPFDHVVIASANRATRTLDAVWLMLGFDPFGFRLADRPSWRAGYLLGLGRIVVV